MELIRLFLKLLILQTLCEEAMQGVAQAMFYQKVAAGASTLDRSCLKIQQTPISSRLVALHHILFPTWGVLFKAAHSVCSC